MGRGSSKIGGGKGAGAKQQTGGGAITALDNTKVQRANGTSVLGNAGDRVQRTYDRNTQEIGTLNLTDQEKVDGIKRQHELATATLDIMAGNPNPYAAGAGPARFNQQRVSRGANQIASAENAIDTHMQSLRDKSAQNTKNQANQRRATALQNAMSNGLLSVTIDGREYYRTRRNSSTWRVR